jgi:hypothetical protein
MQADRSQYGTLKREGKIQIADVFDRPADGAAGVMFDE